MKRRQRMNRISVAIGLCLCLVLSAFQVRAASSLVYIGARGNGNLQDTPQGGVPEDCHPQGIYAARLHGETGKLTPLGVQAVLDAASWLEKHPNMPVLYSVAYSSGGKSGEGDLLSFEIDKAFGKLYLINKVKSGGSDPTHLDIDPVSKTLFVANHESSNISAFPLLPDGSIGPIASEGKSFSHGPHPRQEKAEPHGVAIDPTHRYLLCADFGADRIFVYKFDGATREMTRADPPYIVTPPASAPRHLVFHPNGLFLYVINESNADVCTYSFNPDNGNLKLLQTIETYPDGWRELKSGSEIATSEDGRFVYATLREGQNCVLVYAVDEQDGTLTEIQRVSSQGNNPRSFGIDPNGKWMLVTNVASDSVDVFSIDYKTGMLEATGESLRIPKPVTVVFFAD